LKIAYVSFEYPPDTAVGGIATYVHQVANMMRKRGHHVEVFCGSPDRTITETIDGVTIHRIKSKRQQFPKDILPVFTERQIAIRFDLLESPEYMGDGYYIKKQFPLLPLVVKLHTPSFFIHEMSNFYVSASTKARYILGGLIRGKISKPFWKWVKKEEDPEYLITQLADQIHTPSVSLGDIVSEKWNIQRQKISNVPYPFLPNPKFLAIPSLNGGCVFGFIGRLEVRKGMIVLTEAAKKVLKEVPHSRFLIVGKSLPSHLPGISMKDYVMQQLQQFATRVEFKEAAPDEIPGILSTIDVCVYPSIWENFPNVCLEAMSAARAIVGSVKGGMKDMLEKPEAGLLIDPLKPGEIANAVIRLLNNKELAVQLGKAARNKILSVYNSESIGSLMENKYKEIAIK
jgi:glycogen(starch) synthase